MTFYLSCITCLVGLLAAIYLSCNKNAKKLGKEALYPGAAKQIELQETKTEETKTEETPAVVASTAPCQTEEENKENRRLETTQNVEVQMDTKQDSVFPAIAETAPSNTDNSKEIL